MLKEEIIKNISNDSVESIYNKNLKEFKKLELFLNKLHGEQILHNIYLSNESKGKSTAYNILYNHSNKIEDFSIDIKDSKEDLMNILKNNNLPLKERIQYREIYKFIELIEKNFNDEDPINNAFLTKKMTEYIKINLDNSLSKKEFKNEKEKILSKAFNRTVLKNREKQYYKNAVIAINISETINYIIEKTFYKNNINLFVNNKNKKEKSMLESKDYNELKKLTVLLKIKNIFNKIVKPLIFTAFIGKKTSELLDKDDSEEMQIKIKKAITNTFNNNFDNFNELDNIENNNNNNNNNKIIKLKM